MSKQMLKYKWPGDITLFVSSLAFKRLGAHVLRAIGVGLEVFERRRVHEPWKDVDMVVIEPLKDKRQPKFVLEDGGITLRVRLAGFPEKCYVKIDDYGPPAAWEMFYGEEEARELKKALKTRYTLTVIMPEEW